MAHCMYCTFIIMYVAIDLMLFIAFISGHTSTAGQVAIANKTSEDHLLGVLHPSGLCLPCSHFDILCVKRGALTIAPDSAPSEENHCSYTGGPA